MKLFVINLDRQPERLSRIEQMFGELQLQFIRVSAVDRERLSIEEIRNWQSPDAGVRHLRSGETACFLSHRECWRRIVDEGLPYAAIFEDDIHLGIDAAALLRNGDWIPAAADIVKIETKLQYARVDRISVGKIGDRTLNRMRSKHAGAGGYILTRGCAEKLLRMSNFISSPVDQFMFNTELPSAASLALVQLLPAVCVQDYVDRKPVPTIGLGSDLHDERRLPKPRGAGKLWRLVERPIRKFGYRITRVLSNAVSDKRWVFVGFS